MKDELICKNCGAHFSGKYCNNCGQKVYTDKDKSVRQIMGEGFHFLTHFEGTFFKTLTTILSRPGKLSLDYCNGIRKKYFKPFSFFLLLVILYLLFPVFEGLNMSLRSNEHHFFFGKYATQEVGRLIRERHLSESELAEAYHHAGEKTSKFLLFIIIPFVALFSFLVSRKRRKYYYDHFVFSIEACSFFILFSYLLLPLLVELIKWLFGPVPISGNEVGLAIVAGFMFFLTIAARRFFNFKWAISIAYSLFYTVALAATIEFIYKLILFFIAIHLV